MNLNLLPVLQILLKTRSVSATADALGTSQPAVSDALGRLRAMLDDQLLIRVGSRLKPTSYAESLIEPLDTLCAGLEAFLTKDGFDHRTAKRNFVIASSDLGGYVLGRPILKMLAEQAPQTSLQIIDITQDLTMRLASREVDIALLPEFSIEDLAPAPLRFQALIDLPRVVLMRRSHPLTRLTTVTDQDLSRFRHIGFQPDLLKSFNRILKPTNGVPVEFLARLGHALLLPHMLPGTDLVAIIPKQLADDMTEPFGLESRAIADDGPPIRFGFAWSPVQDRDPAHCWFRSAIALNLGKQPLTADRRNDGLRRDTQA